MNNINNQIISLYEKITKFLFNNTATRDICAHLPIFGPTFGPLQDNYALFRRIEYLSPHMSFSC